MLKTGIHNSLEIATMLKMQSIAFPALGTAVYKFPKALTAHCLFSEAIKYADRKIYSERKTTVTDIRFTLLDDLTAAIFMREFDNRDFSLRHAPYKHALEEMEDYLAHDFKCMVTEQGFGRQIPRGALVQLHYKGKFTDGKVFASSYDSGKPTAVRVGVGAAIPGWDKGVCGLQKGSKATLYCPPDYAYGEEGLAELVPPNTPVVFELEVVDFDELK